VARGYGLIYEQDTFFLILGKDVDYLDITPLPTWLPVQFSR